MTTQDVVNAVSVDMRQVLYNSGTDAALIAGWVDRIHKDILHGSVYTYLVQGSSPITTVVGQTSYTLPGNIRNILLVFDRTNNRNIPPWNSEGLGPGEEGSAATTMTTRPNYFVREGQTNLFLFPALQSNDVVATIEIHYTNYVATVGINDTLLLPDDALDLIVSGVNMLAASYLKNTAEAQAWQTLYSTNLKE